ncbi:MAG: hypothetical protein LBF63_01820, partial [Treponema sp.]|nr:hypothetical protein [Treponema sp.]
MPGSSTGTVNIETSAGDLTVGAAINGTSITLESDGDVNVNYGLTASSGAVAITAIGAVGGSGAIEATTGSVSIEGASIGGSGAITAGTTVG